MEDLRVLQVFFNPVITDIILRHLSFQELLDFSLVSKACCYRAREQLRSSSRNCKISLHEVEPGTDVCRFLEGLNELLKTSLSVPFAGFCTGRLPWPRVKCSENCVLKVAEKSTTSPGGSIDRQSIIASTYVVLLERIGYKFLRFGPQRDYCEGIRLFLEEILSRKSSEILRIEVACSPSLGGETRIRQRIPNWHSLSEVERLEYGDGSCNYSYWPLLNSNDKPKYNFKNLKTLRFSHHLNEFILAELARGLMLSAPNLTTVYGSLPLRPMLLYKYPVEKLGAFTVFDHLSVYTEYEDVQHILERKPRFQEIHLRLYKESYGEEECQQDFLQKIQTRFNYVLRYSYDSVTWLNCHFYVFAMLSNTCMEEESAGVNKSICLRNLRRLSLYSVVLLLGFTLESHPELEIFEDELQWIGLVDYSRFSPRLKEIELGDQMTPSIVFDNNGTCLALASRAREIALSRRAANESYTCSTVNKILLLELHQWWSLDLIPKVFSQAREVCILYLSALTKLPEILNSKSEHLSTIFLNTWEDRFLEQIFGYSKAELLELDKEQQVTEFWERVHLFPSSYSIFSARVNKLTVNHSSVPAVLLTYGLCHLIRSRLPGFTLVINDFRTPILTSKIERVLKFADVTRKLVTYPPAPQDAPLGMRCKEFYQYTIVFKR